MRTLSSFGLCATYVLVGVVPIFSQTIPAERWQKFSSAAGGFTILMPGEPHESTYKPEPKDSAFYAEGVKFYGADVGLDQGYFSVVTRIYPRPIGSLKDVPSILD